MAISDVGMFLPGESAYSKPGTYEDALRAEAVKRGTWLASLDQFYAQLEETQREFDVTAAFKEKTLSYEKEAHEAEMAYKYKALSSEETLRTRALDIEERKVSQAGGTNLLGRTSEEKALDFLKTATGQSGYGTWNPTYIQGESYASRGTSSQPQLRSGEIIPGVMAGGWYQGDIFRPGASSASKASGSWWGPEYPSGEWDLY